MSDTEQEQTECARILKKHSVRVIMGVIQIDTVEQGCSVIVDMANALNAKPDTVTIESQERYIAELVEGLKNVLGNIQYLTPRGATNCRFCDVDLGDSPHMDSCESVEIRELIANDYLESKGAE